MNSKVAFDISGLNPEFKAHSKRGLGRYITKLYECLRNYSDKDLDFLYFSQPELYKKNILTKLGDILPYGKTTFKQQIAFPLGFGMDNLKGSSLIHFPAHIDAPAWCPKKYCVTVPDLIPQIFVDLYRADRPDWRFNFARFLENKAIKNADMVIAISENTAKDVHEIIGVPEEKIFVTPLGVDEKEFQISDSFDAITMKEKLKIPKDRSIILHLGGIDQRKNILTLVSVFKKLCDLRREQKKSVPILFLGGRIFEDEQFPKLEQKIKDLKLEEDVILHGFVEKEDLAGVFHVADVFCFLSLYEGFGLPVLEAMSAGLPVVCSDNSSITEVAKGAAALVNPQEEVEVIFALNDILTNPERGKELVLRGRERVKRYTWKKTGEKTIEAYLSCLSN